MSSMRAPCEVSLWYVLPLIRKALARQLVEKHGMTQAAVARKMSLTDAAVSQYLSGKRAGKDPDVSFMMEEIEKSAAIIAKSKDAKLVQKEICRLCRYASEGGYIDKIVAQRKCVKCE